MTPAATLGFNDECDEYGSVNTQSQRADFKSVNFALPVLSLI